VRQLLPVERATVDLAEAYGSAERPTPAGRPWVAVNMITSADGATAVGGRSGPLGGPADKAVFAALRASADVVLVGAGTARAEGYGPARNRPDGSPGPRIAVVTRSGALEPDARLFSGARPVVVTCESCPPGRRAALGAVADVVVAGDDAVDLGAALGALADQGAGVVVCEGGPTLNGDLVAAGLIDEWCLSLAPVLAGGTSARASNGPSLPATTPMRLAHLLEDDGFLFARYVRSPDLT
jgi:riboflavin biosynthesis pyrimidine reductase